MLMYWHDIFLFKLIVIFSAIACPAIASDDLFELTIRPLLEQKCLSCHNSDALKGDLSLETRSSLQRGGESGKVIVPGDSGASYLMDLITPTDGKAEMPKGGEHLSAAEIAAVRRWIDEGASWPKNVTLQPQLWWSLRLLQRPEIPKSNPLKTVDGGTFQIRTPVDEFVAYQLSKRGLKPSPEADRRTLIRRLYFDLIGLPPTPQETEAFIADPAPLAYEALVDRLLESPQYGERWARHWLDIVKYADTCGYDKDKLRRNSWPYRDYVIRSLNDDKPYTRFVKEQIAGDVFYPNEPDGILGTGFIAAGPWDFIGHVEVSEAKTDGKIARSMDRDDMVSSAINTFCSATIQCARCHDHKFDPYTQSHYYGLQAVFAAVDRAERVYNLDPKIEQQRIELAQLLKEQKQKFAHIELEIEKAGGEKLTRLNNQIQELKSAADPDTKAPEFGYHSAISDRDDDAKWVQVDLAREYDLETITLRPCHDDFAGIGAGFGFPVRFRIQAAVNPSDFESDPLHGLLIDRTAADFVNPGINAVQLPVNAQKVRYLRITATKLAPRHGDFIFALAELQAFDSTGANVAQQCVVSAKDSIEAPVRWGARNLIDGIWPGTPDENAALRYASLVNEREQLLDELRTPERLQAMEDLKTNIESTQSDLQNLPPGHLVYAAATDFPAQGNFRPTQGTPREVRILNRGNVTDPLEVAIPGALPVIPGVPAEFDLPTDHTEADRRAALAEWITRKDHPLTWRSIVNRVWQFHFGSGLVASPNDFGRMGQEPSHPELLDWLAVNFRDGGQSFKQLHRLMVTSSTYRQSSKHHDGNAAIDDSNHSLWRMPRRRLEAEEIRDAVLSVSGCLNPEMGGPGFFLFELEKEAHSPHYEYQNFNPADPASHRRSIYRFIVRSQPNPLMTTLDCADSSQSTPLRSETVTALQALALLNNKFNLEMSERFADRLQASAPELEKQITFGFQLVTGRDPTAQEQQELVNYAREFGMKNLCRVLFNLNEFIYID